MEKLFTVLFWAFVVLIGVPAVAAVVLMAVGSFRGENGENNQPTRDGIADENPSGIELEGKVSDTLSFFGDATDLQREALIEEIEGEVVEWRLSLYDVNKKNGELILQSLAESGRVTTFCHVIQPTDSELSHVMKLETGDRFTCKGAIDHIDGLRVITIKPAVLIF